MVDGKHLRFSCSVVALFLTAALGCKMSGPASVEPDYHRIKIGPTEATANPELQPLSRSANGQAYWTAIDANGNLDSTRRLYIEFETQDVFPETVPVVVNGKTRYRVRCTGGYCESGPIGAKAVEGKPYSYWQTLVTPGGTENSADGRIIINR